MPGDALFAVSVLAGIGFTISVFMTGLAYEEGGAFHRQAKLGVLAASTLAAVTGAVLLSLCHRFEREPPRGP